MTLEERYNAAGATTYVGRVKSLQAAEVGARDGVNFMDGTGRGQGNNAPDEYQTEFKRNAEGDFRYGGGGKVPGNTDNKYSLSRWLPKALDKAFGPGGYFLNNRYTTINDVKNSQAKIHKFAPITGKDFTSVLQEMSKGRVLGSSAGPSPSGLMG